MRGVTAFGGAISRGVVLLGSTIGMGFLSQASASPTSNVYSGSAPLMDVAPEFSGSGDVNSNVEEGSENIAGILGVSSVLVLVILTAIVANTIKYRKQILKPYKTCFKAIKDKYKESPALSSPQNSERVAGAVSSLRTTNV